MEHGGDLSSLSLAACSKLIDLSTGISPYPYPYHPILAKLDLTCLPQRAQMEGLVDAILTYLGNIPALSPANIVLAGGTQSLISQLPYCIGAHSSLWIAAPSYQEHRKAWNMAGHHVYCRHDDLDKAANIAIINPDNPTGAITSAAELHKLQDQARAAGGLLIIDEAFIDPHLDHSFISHAKTWDNLVILRSFGKFFGLGGVRLGFMICNPDLALKLNARLGAWAVSTAALAIAKAAYQDTGWQHHMRAKLSHQTRLLRMMFQDKNIEIIGHTDLFVTIRHPQADALHQHLLSSGIYCRHFPISHNQDWSDGSWLRFGIPESPAILHDLAGLL